MDELVEASGINDRTVRYYIEQGILQHARGRGRSSYYTTEHLERLTRVADLRDRGMSIAEIRESLAPAAVGEPATPAESWERYPLHPDLEVHLKAEAGDEVRMLLRRFQQISNEWFATLELGESFEEH